MKVRGITVCVNYHDLLEITLVRNMRFLSECWVVTSPADIRTKEICHSVPGVRVFETSAFYENGAKFNKGLALEQGFDAMGREGFILIHDSDILLPDNLAWPVLQEDVLYGTSRLIVENPADWSPTYDWKRAKRSRDRIGIGYFQLFHAKSETIKQTEKRPTWYDVTFAHAGGGDGYFAARWPSEKKIMLPYPVLHLGPRDRNWFGRSTPLLNGERVDGAKDAANLHRQYRINMGWESGQRSQLNEHVEVPGYKPTGYITGSGVVPAE